jgi:cation:H+ antiporter
MNSNSVIKEKLEEHPITGGVIKAKRLIVNILTLILMVVGFVLLIKGADLLVEGASAIAQRFNVSQIVIGLTIVAFGTSTPELTVNMVASLSGDTELAIGNVLGSNIANILLILGIAAIIYPLTVHKNTVFKEIPFSLLAAVMIAIVANDIWLDGDNRSVISRTDGLVLIGFMIIFMYYIFGIARKGDSISKGDAALEKDLETPDKPLNFGKSLGLVAIGLAGLVIGGNWIVEGAVALATGLGVSQSLIGLTVVAVGTSLPELATSAVAALKKNTDIAIGNVVGSNIFNTFWILGLSATISPLPFQARSNIDVGMNIFASLLLFLMLYISRGHRIGRNVGIFFVALYIGYTIFLIIQG